MEEDLRTVQVEPEDLDACLDSSGSLSGDSFRVEAVMDEQETYRVHFAHKDGSGTVLRSRVFRDRDEALARRDYFTAQGREARVEATLVRHVERVRRYTVR